MKRKILTIIASVLIIATFGILLTACSKTGYVSVSEVNAGVERENDYGAAKATKLNVGDYDVVDYSTESNYLIMSSVTVGDTGQETVYYVVDAKTNKALYSGKDRPYLLRLSGGGIIWDDVFFTLQSGTDGKITATFMSGERIITDGVDTDGLFTGNYYVSGGRYSAAGGLDIGGGKVIAGGNGNYTVKDKNYSAVAPFTENEAEMMSDYAYYSDGNTVYILNKNNLSLIRSVNFVELYGLSSENNGIFALPDNKLLIQIMDYMPYNTTKDYDLYANDTYYKVRTYIYDVEKDKTKEVKDCEYVFFGNSITDVSNVSIMYAGKIRDDKTLGIPQLQGFDEKLNVAFDIEEILPGTTNITFSGEYTVFYSSERMVIYKGDDRVLDCPRDKISASLYLGNSGIMVSTDGSTLYNADGSYLISLSELDALSFECLDYAENYIIYEKKELDPDTSFSQTYYYAYDKKTGVSEKIAAAGDSRLLGYGFLLAANEDGSDYALYDVVTMEKIVDGLASGYGYVTVLEDRLLFIGTAQNSDTAVYENVHYVLERS